MKLEEQAENELNACGKGMCNVMYCKVMCRGQSG
jgi:hypothetical protein